MSRLIIRSVVVLPHPDGPTSTQISPSSTSRLNSWTATVPFGIPLGDLVEADQRTNESRGEISSPRLASACAMVLASNVDRWLWWDWIGRNTDLIWSSLREHVILAACAVGFGLLISIPLGVAAARWRWLYAPVLALTGVLYTIPSLAAFALVAADHRPVADDCARSR